MKRIILISLIIIAGCSFSGKEIVRLDKDLSEANDYFNSGIESLQNNNYDNSLEFLESAFQKYSLIDNSQGKIYSSLQLAKLYNFLEKNVESEYWFDKAQFLSKNLNSNIYQIVDLTKIEILFNNDEYKELIEYSAMIDYKNYAKDILAQIVSYLLISKIEQSQEYNVELEIVNNKIPEFEKLYIDNELENPLVLSFLYYSVGYSEVKNNKYESAIKSFNKSYDIDLKYSNYSGMAVNLNSLGFISEMNNNNKEAGLYYLKASDIFRFLNDERNSFRSELLSIKNRIISEGINNAIKERFNYILFNAEGKELTKEIDTIKKLISQKE